MNVFKLIKAEYDDKLTRSTEANLDGDEEMKSEGGDLSQLAELPLLRRISSEMRVSPYSRLSSLTLAVNTL